MMPFQTILILFLAGVLGTIIVHALVSGPTTAAQERNRSEQWKLYREGLTIFALFLAALAALYQGSVMSKQADTLNSQLAEMKSAAVQTDKIIQSYADFATAAKVSATAEEQSAATARSSLIMNQRANIIFNSTSLKSPEIGRGIFATIAFTNRGRENASFDRKISFTRWIAADWNDGTAKGYYVSLADKCRAITDVSGSGVAYSEVPYAIDIDTMTDVPTGQSNIVVDDSVIKGDVVLAIYTCIAYRTFDAVHHSAQCVFYRAGLTSILNSLNVCEWGQLSD